MGVEAGAHEIHELISRDAWVLGGQNFDEDLHFSSLYLRASSSLYRSAETWHGYRTVICVNEHFDEHYYLLEDECRASATQLIQTFKKDPDALAKILSETRSRSDDLAAFVGEYRDTDLSRLGLSDVLSLYRHHRLAQERLYVPARVSEVLDKGGEHFTKYLFSLLESDPTKQLGELDVPDAFYYLTTPTRPSVIREEISDFERLVTRIRQSRVDMRALIKRTSPVANDLTKRTQQLIQDHADRWGYLHYHGYGRRELPGPDFYMPRIVTALAATELNTKEAEERLRIAVRRKEELVSRLGLEVYEPLFRLYSEIGLTKLYRRLAQLKAFHFLDRLLAAVSRLLGRNESLIRCLLPDEIEALLTGKLILQDRHLDRQLLAVYVIHGTEDFVLVGPEARSVRDELRKRTLEVPRDDWELKGTRASPGQAIGIARVIIRPEDAEGQGFEVNDILVSEAPDPDLTPLMIKAGAIVSQQGGVTSHAAIVCRELDKPAIVGVLGLLDYVHSGDEVMVDADRGIVRLAGRSRSRSTKS